MADEVESRMEQIRLKNEELEKKHKEILQDELEAKKIGAVVETKQNSSLKETSHPLDKLDLDYDVNEVMREKAKNPDYKPKNRRPILGKKQLEEIPPDPKNFLREDDASNDTGEMLNQNVTNNKKPQQNNRNRRQPKVNNNNNDEQQNKSNFNESPGQRSHRNQNQRPRQNQNNLNRNNSEEATAIVNSNQTSSSPRKPPQQLRNERRSAPNISDNQQSNNNSDMQQNDTNKMQSNRQRRPNNNSNNRPQNHHQQHSRPNRDNNSERNNITVEVNDEVRSVKLKTSEKKIGTGRVRPQADDFVDNSDNHEVNEENQLKEGTKNKNSRSRQRKPKPKSDTEILQLPIFEKIVITKTSVQERLNRSKMLDEKDVANLPKIENESSTAEN